MIDLLYKICAFLVALGVLVVIHELGHYWVARWCKVKVLRFSVGFGKPLKTWVRGADKTEWVVAAVPLGGYVKMLDEREGPVAPAELARAFNRQNVWKRIAIVIAGPAANLLLAIVLYWGLFMHGVPGMRPVVGAPVAGSASAKAGFVAGDTILGVGEEAVPTWQEAHWLIVKAAMRGESVAVKVLTASDEPQSRLLEMSGLTKADLDGDVLTKLGLTRFKVPVEIQSIRAGSAAERAGLKAGDILNEINSVRVEGIEQAIGLIRESAGKSIVVELRREGSGVVTLPVTPDAVTVTEGQKEIKIGRIGADLGAMKQAVEKYRVVVSYGPLDSIPHAVYKTWDMSVFSLQMLGKMVVGELSLKNLSGPITIADYAGKSAKVGWISYLVFLALISISLGVLNLLPIPLLDGGHLMYYIVEIFKGAPVSEQFMEIGQRVGMGVLLLMMAFALYNDVNRLISG